MRMASGLVVVAMSACRPSGAAPVIDAAPASDFSAAPVVEAATSTEPAASSIVDAAPASSRDAAAPSQPCLDREVSRDGECARDRPHFFIWDAHACAVTRESVASVEKRCRRMGPDRGMNIMNWCCP